MSTNKDARVHTMMLIQEQVEESLETLDLLGDGDPRTRRLRNHLTYAWVLCQTYLKQIELDYAESED